MNISRLTEKVARIEADQKRTRQFDISVVDALLDGGPNERRGRRTYTPERISDGELSFLSDVRHLGLTGADDIADAASRHGIGDERLAAMRERYFVDLSTEERGALDRLKEHPVRTQGSPVEAGLERKGFIHTLLPQERAFLNELSSLDLSGDQDLAISMIRSRHGITAQLQDAFEKAGVLKLPKKEEVQWLKAFEAGAGLGELKELADRLGVKTWALKNRALIDERGARKANTRPMVMQGDLLIFDGPKVRWRREKPSELADRQLGAVPPERKDLGLLTTSLDELGSWQAIRQKRLLSGRAADKDQFDMQLWGLLSPTEQAAILALGESDLTRSQAAFRQEHWSLFDEAFKARMRAQRIGNDEYFFLASLRRQPDEMERLAGEYKVSPERLKASGFLDYPDEPEKAILHALMNGEDLDESGQKVLQDLERRGFVHRPRDDEKRFLAYVAETKPADKAALLKAADLFLYDERKLSGLKARGFLSYLDEHEQAFLEAMVKDPQQPVDELALRHDVARPDLLKNRLTPEGVNPGVTVDDKPKFRLKPRVQYREERGLLADRVSRPVSHDPRLTPKDTGLFLSDLMQEPLSLGQVERIIELKAAGKSLADAHIPTNQEMAFLRKIGWRKEDMASLFKIAQADFGLSEASVKGLMDGGFIRARGKKYLPYEEPKLLRDARVWLNSTDAMRRKLSMVEPHPELVKAMKGKAARIDVGEKLIDYEIYFKVARGEKLSKKESERLEFLRENGLHPEGREFENWVKEEPKSWRMKEARREAYLQHYEKSHGVSLPILEFINTFKQATREQILRQGLSMDDLRRYADGLGSGGRHKLLHEHVLLEKSGKPIIYYSIAHTGPISGRKFLEHRLNIAKSDIPEKPQQRRDLLHHDLKVVDCVQEVIRMKKAEGKEPVKLLNEAMQFARAKGGLQNNQRQGGPAFMDAEIIFRREEEPAQGQSSGSGSEAIAVEYGNYTLERMREKLQNCTFDHAYVFAKPDYIAKYKAHITVPNVTYIPMR